MRENEKTREFIKDKAFLDKLQDLSNDSQNLVTHMADHRVMTALAVLLDVDVTVPQSKNTSLHFNISTRVPFSLAPVERIPNKQPETVCMPTMESDNPQNTFQSEVAKPIYQHLAIILYVLLSALTSLCQNKTSIADPTSLGDPLPKTISEKIAKCRELKDEGNKFFKAKQWKKAIKKYHHALMYVKGVTDRLDSLPLLEATLGRQQPSEQDRKDAIELMLNLLNNLSCEL